MNRLVKPLSFIAVVATVIVTASLPAADLTAQQLTETIGRRRGICAVLGKDAVAIARQLGEQSELTVYVQMPSADDVANARREFYAVGLLGTRVFVEQGDATQIHLADHLADAVVVDRTLNDVETNEAMRVLRPRGKLIAGDRVSIKPVPDGTGQWTHPYHGADNNPQSEDQLARAPYQTKFLTTPWYGPMPEITLSAGGRLFKAFGFLAFKEREWPMVGKLLAMDGYNGTLLWQRDLEPGFMMHRNTLVATEDILYVADNKSCKLIDAASGEIRDEIVVPAGIADGLVWKWMTVRNGILYALVGEQEKLHTPHRGTRTQTGWPWQTVRGTYGDYQDTWGYGRTLMAVDLQTKDVLWTHREEEKIDSRATCMNSERIFIYSHKRFLAAIRADDGKQIWRNSGGDVLSAIGDHDRAQDPRLGYATSAYLKCNDDALYFAGPQRHKLVAVSASDGNLLWTFDDGNVQLVLRDDGLYAMGRMNSSKQFDYLTGNVLADLQCFRGNCTRATGTADSIFARGYRHSGTLRYDFANSTPRRLSAMRPACQDGVVAANGQLYWGPWMCDCNHSLVGVISLTAAGDFEFEADAKEQQRLQQFRVQQDAAKLTIDDADWPTYRADNQRSGSSPATVSEQIKPLWTYQPPTGVTTTAPVAVGDNVLFAGSDGVVRCVDAASGDVRWEAFTGGMIHYPPTVAQNRVFVGSGDGFVYVLDTTTGQTHWQFRAAPARRNIPVYGRLMSTWPVASGVLVEEGVAYAAAGIVSHDGTHVYALDAQTGRLKWQNNTSGNLLDDGDVIGVSVQGHLLLDGGKLYMAGGNVVSPAIYDAETGVCLNELPHLPKQSLDDHWQMQRSSRGSELYLAGGRVFVGGRMLYSPGADGPASRYNANYILQVANRDLVIQGNDRAVMRIDLQRPAGDKPAVIWQDSAFTNVDAIALCQNAVVVAGRTAESNVLTAMRPSDGQHIWQTELPSRSKPWGIAVDRRGRVVTTLADGRVACFGSN